MWPFKSKLKLHFHDPEYDAIMEFFRQAIYLDKIVVEIENKNNQPGYVTGLMNSFVQIYETAGEKIKRIHHKKTIHLNNMNREKVEQEIKYSKVLMVNGLTIKDCSLETIDLLIEIANFDREAKYNNTVRKTLSRVLGHLYRFAEKLKDCPKETSDWYCEQYGDTLIRFLNSINDSTKLYHSLSIWLSEDKTSLEKYRKVLEEKVMKRTKTLRKADGLMFKII
jgi:hypothetical protein